MCVSASVCLCLCVGTEMWIVLDVWEAKDLMWSIGRMQHIISTCHTLFNS